MGKSHTIDSFFKRKQSNHVDTSLLTPELNVQTSMPTPEQEQRSLKSPRIEGKGWDINYLERDPGKRIEIWKCRGDLLDEVRQAYINYGPYQCILPEYPYSGSEKHPRRFQSSWFKVFSSWLEYSPSKDAAFCLPCYLQKILGPPNHKSWLHPCCILTEVLPYLISVKPRDLQTKETKQTIAHDQSIPPVI